MATRTNTTVLNKTIEPMHSHRSRHREQPTQPPSDNRTLAGYWEINGVKAHCLLDSGSEGVLLSLEFMRATGIKTFALEKPIALQLACIGSWSMINYGTHATIKIGRCCDKTVKQIRNDPITMHITPKWTSTSIGPGDQSEEACPSVTTDRHQAVLEPGQDFGVKV